MPAIIKFCTITGIDNLTYLDEVIALSKQYPFVEWGMLYSPSRAGNELRYMNIEPLLNTARYLRFNKRTPVNIALHLCGAAVSEFAGENYRKQHRCINRNEEFDAVVDVTEYFDRIQLNFNNNRFSNQQLYKLVDAARGIRTHTQVITQYNENNMNVWKAFEYPGGINHAVLFDASGGTGKELCKPIKQPIPGISCGYAGGIGPDNINEILGLLEESEGVAWIDMESKVRDEYDILDLNKVTQVLEAVEGYLQNTLKLA